MVAGSKSLKEEPKVVVSPEKTEKKEEKPVAEAPATPVEKEEEGEVVASVDLHVEARVESEEDTTSEEAAAAEKQKPGEPPTPHVEA